MEEGVQKEKNKNGEEHNMLSTPTKKQNDAVVRKGGNVEISIDDDDKGMCFI